MTTTWPRKGSRGIWLAFLTLFIGANSAYAESLPRNEVEAAIKGAVSFLLANQADDGAWGTDTRRLYTSVTVARVLSGARDSDLLPDGVDSTAVLHAIDRAYQALADSAQSSVEQTAHLASLRHLSGRGVDGGRAFILNQQQADGGWGITIEHRSTVRDTAVVVDAVLGDGIFGLAEDRLIGAADFLSNSQISLADQGVGTGGAWVHGIGGQSQLETTARTICSLRLVGKHLGSESAVYDASENAVAYLRSVVDPGTGWPVDLHSTEVLAATLDALSGMRQPGEIAPMVLGALEAGHDAGGAEQKYWTSDGSANQSPSPQELEGQVLTTAHVAHALLHLPFVQEAGEQLPDLRIDMISLANDVTDGNENLELSSGTTIFNDNDFIVNTSHTKDAVPEIRVQFYSGDPRRTSVVGGEIVRAIPVGNRLALPLPLPSPSSTDLVTDMGISELPVLGHEVLARDPAILGAVIDVDNRLPETDETDNIYAMFPDGTTHGHASDDIAIVGHSLSVSHTDLVDAEVVTLSASVWNAGNSDIAAGSQFRVWFRAAPFDADYSDGDPVSPPDYEDGTLIDYVDITVPADGLAAQAQWGEPISLDWIPTRSPSLIVTVQVEPLGGAGVGDADASNNADQQAFEFETGDLSLHHVRAANGDLLFYLTYGDNCYSSSHGFAAYFRESASDFWLAINNAPYGTGGSLSPCIFLIGRAQAWDLQAGSYQALGEVWQESSNSGEQDFIDDAILQFIVPSITEITAIATSFANDPSQLADQVYVSALGKLYIDVYYRSNVAPQHPGFNASYQIVFVEDDVVYELNPPVAGSIQIPTLSPGSGVATVEIDLSGQTAELTDGVSYAVIVSVAEDLANGVPPTQRTHAFAISSTSGYILRSKRVFFEDIQVDAPVPAQNGDRVRVDIPIEYID